MGAKAAKQVTLRYAPGVYTNEADLDAINRWKSSNNIRWHKGLAEKIGGYERITLTGYNSGVYTGKARTLHDWASLDSQQWIAIGTNCKLHLVNNGVLYDITPRRKSSNLTSPFTTTNGSTTVTINDPDNRAEPGDHVTILSSAAVGGITINGDYDIVSIVDPDHFTITAASAATSGATGGGGTTISYDIYCGLASNGERLGWGTGTWGAGTWGTPRTVGSGIPALLRIWSVDNWGEDLLAAQNEGELYLWDRTAGPNARATIVEGAPTGIQRMIVNPEKRFVILFGCSGFDGAFDPMLIRWASQETFDDWIPTDDNTAGDKRLDHGSRLVTALKTRSQILVWSDTHLYSMQFSGLPFIFGVSDPLGQVAIAGPNAAVDKGGIAYFLGFDDFFSYDGTLNVLPCDVHTEIFGSDSIYRLDKTQAEKITASIYHSKGEVRWDYPSVSGLGENDRYVIYNDELKCWYTGSIVRTAYHGISRAITGYMTNPYGANGGYLFKHEVGTDQVDALTTVMPWHLESWDMHFGSDGGTGEFARITSLLPVFDRFTGSFNVYLKKKAEPQNDYETKGPWTCDDTTTKVPAKARGYQIAVRFESGSAVGQDVRFGHWKAFVARHGTQ